MFLNVYNEEKWKSEIEFSVSLWNKRYNSPKLDPRPISDFMIFVWDTGYIIMTQEKYERLSKRNKEKLERLELFNKWN